MTFKTYTSMMLTAVTLASLTLPTVVSAQQADQPTSGGKASTEVKMKQTIDPTAGFKTLKEAKENADAFLETSENIGYTIIQNEQDGKYYATFSLTDDSKNLPQVKEDIDPTAGFEKLEDAVANAEAFLKASDNVGYTIAKGVDDKFYATFSLTDDKKVVPEEDQAKDNKDDVKKEETKKATEKQAAIDPTAGFEKLEDAVANAEAFLKDSDNVGYAIAKGPDGKFYATFSLTDDKKVVPEVEKKEEIKQTADTQSTVDPTAGFEKLEDAVANAEAFLKQSHNIGYSIAKGADGKFYAKFSLTDDKKVVPQVEKKEAEKADHKPVKDSKVKEVKDKESKDKTPKKDENIPAKVQTKIQTKTTDKEQKQNKPSTPTKKLATLPQTGATIAGLGLGLASVLTGLGLTLKKRK